MNATRHLRVALMCPEWPRTAHSNGIVTYVDAVRSGLVLAGTEVRLLNAGNPAGTSDPSVLDLEDFEPSRAFRSVCLLYDRITGRPHAEWFGARRVRRALVAINRERRLDLVEMEESHGVSGYVRGAIPCPTVVRMHGPHFLVAPGLGLSTDGHRAAQEHRAILTADGLSSPSQFVLDAVRKEYGAELPHAEVIPNTTPIPDQSRLWSSDRCDAKTILFVGRFERLKGADLMVHAFDLIVKRHPESRLIFVGADDGVLDENGRLWKARSYLREHLSERVSSRVEFHGARMPSIVNELRGSAAVTVVASRFESFSMTAVEALSYGCPVVGARCGGIPEVIDDGRSGLLFDAGSAESLASVVNRLLDDPALAARLGAQGHQDAMRRFAPDVVGEQMNAFYRRVCARFSGVRRADVSRPPESLRRGFQ